MSLKYTRIIRSRVHIWLAIKCDNHAFLIKFCWDSHIHCLWLSSHNKAGMGRCLLSCPLQKKKKKELTDLRRSICSECFHLYLSLQLQLLLLKALKGNFMLSQLSLTPCTQVQCFLPYHRQQTLVAVQQLWQVGVGFSHSYPFQTAPDSFLSYTPNIIVDFLRGGFHSHSRRKTRKKSQMGTQQGFKAKANSTKKQINFT